MFFDEPVKALDSEANAEDNKQDELLKIIEETAENSNLTEEQEIPSPIIEGESDLHPIIDPVQGRVIQHKIRMKFQCRGENSNK